MVINSQSYWVITKYYFKIKTNFMSFMNILDLIIVIDNKEVGYFVVE